MWTALARGMDDARPRVGLALQPLKPTAALSNSLMRVCQPSPPARSAEITSLSRRRVINVLLSPRGRPRRRTASTICGTASRAGRAVRSSAALSGASSLMRLRRPWPDFFIDLFLCAIGPPKADQPNAAGPVGEDQSADTAPQETDRRLPTLPVGTSRAVNDNSARPIELPRLLEGDAVLGEVALSLSRIPNERHYL